MRSITRFSLMVLLVLMASVVAACSGGAGGGGGGTTGPSPADVAKSWFEGAFNGETEAVRALTCAAGAADVDVVVQGLSSVTSATAAAGVEATIDLSGLTYTVSDQTDTAAVVNVGGNLKVTAAGVDQEFPMSDFPPFPMVVEGGAWKLCPPDA